VPRRCRPAGMIRWPRFASAALVAGVHRVLSLHLYSHGAATGALNLFGYHARRLNAESEAADAMLATHAATALIAANRQHRFESALASRDVIGQLRRPAGGDCELSPRCRGLQPWRGSGGGNSASVDISPFGIVPYGPPRGAGPGRSIGLPVLTGPILRDTSGSLGARGIRI
jgi:hypothetical protein